MTNLPDLELPQYFGGQRLTAALLNANAGTERERRWFHNRALHGTGISTGLFVAEGDSGKELVVERGHAIDPEGRDLVVTAPVTIQVPPVAGQPDPERFYVVVRWPDEAEPVTGEGECGAAGAVGLPEHAAVEILPEAPPEAVPLAIIEVQDCALVSLSLSPRNVLAERRLPYVDGAEYAPTSGPPGASGAWEVRSAGGNAYALGVTVDTSVAGFQVTPRYQARVSGGRVGALPDGSGDYLLWTADAYVTDSTRNSLTLEVAILSVWELGQTGAGAQRTFQEFIDAHFKAKEPEFLVAVVNELDWAVTWIGVEGAI